ncbi:hypothetical protein F5B20DRAFT_525858 [Whalleya microplaca]|nr:hypothetical protein F5B20DRAFT_525858 [Whalleya microplaca]
MARSHSSRLPFEILSDASSSEDDNALRDYRLDANPYGPLRHLSVSHSQNHQSYAGSSPTSELKRLHHISTEPVELNEIDPAADWNSIPIKQPGRRLKRPSIAANTFELLETVPEDESQLTSDTEIPRVSGVTQRYLELPVDHYSHHPLSIAARSIPPIEEQIAKHHDGQFEWVLSVKIPVHSTPRRYSSTSSAERAPKIKTIFFGCNLLPTQEEIKITSSETGSAPSTYTLLVTPLEESEELLEIIGEPAGEGNMALETPDRDRSTSINGLQASPRNEAQQPIPAASPIPTENEDSFLEVITARSPAISVARIEDSVDALDELEEQLEAFDEAAHFRRLMSPPAAEPAGKAPARSLSVRSSGARRAVTPQPKRSTPPKSGSASVRGQTTSEPRRPTVRKSASMVFLDVPKFKTEDKPVAQPAPKRSTVRSVASLQPPKQPARSTRQPTVPSFKLPGDAVAQQLKEKREARLAAQAAAAESATRPTAASLRRANSARAPTRPTFELPGEAISRRKREEREARLKAQEEEERKRREFKARPIRSGAASSTLPRDTVASRARQNKALFAENSGQKVSPSQNRPVPRTLTTNSRSPLSKTNNQWPSRGRELEPEPWGTQTSHTTSSTARSISSKRSNMSTDEVQQQRVRGSEIYHRDNSWVNDREREKREREALAKLAREEAAERSRQQSREWAAKQARKRMTVGSFRDVIA